MSWVIRKDGRHDPRRIVAALDQKGVICQVKAVFGPAAFQFKAFCRPIVALRAQCANDRASLWLAAGAGGAAWCAPCPSPATTPIPPPIMIMTTRMTMGGMGISMAGTAIPMCRRISAGHS
jgi:hypothetical protein